MSDVDIVTIAGMFLTQWEKLSPFLGLIPAQEGMIRRTFRDYSDQKREALRQWKRNKGHAATYRALITAATAASNMDLVDNVKAMLQTREKSTGSIITLACRVLLVYIVVGPSKEAVLVCGPLLYSGRAYPMFVNDKWHFM